MLNIGCHLSAAKGYMNMGKEAKSIDANTFQFFTRNPRGGTQVRLRLFLHSSFLVLLIILYKS